MEGKYYDGSYTSGPSGHETSGPATQASARSLMSPMGSSSSPQPKRSQGLLSFYLRHGLDKEVGGCHLQAEGGCLYSDPKGQPDEIWA